jgi:DNA/RNA-binding domain of Phe-tRNA-synthetase-like protein
MQKKNDVNNNHLLTAETLLCVNDPGEDQHIIQAYRQLYSKLRFLGKYLKFLVFRIYLSF